MSRERLFTLNDPHAMRISAELAAEIGLMESIVLLQFEFLLSITKVSRRGKPWIRATLEELRQEHFKWSSRATIWRAIQSLHKRRLLLIDNYNAAGFDKTQWFTLDMKNVARLKSVRVFQDETGSVFQSETGGLFQDETSQASDPELQGGNSEALQDETGGRESRQDVPDRDVDVANRAPRRDQDETTIERDLPPGDLQPSPEGAEESGPVRTDQIMRAVIDPGAKHPHRFKGHLANEIKKLLSEGFDPVVVTEAARRCVRGRRPHPGNMPALVVEVQNQRDGTTERNGHRPFATPTEDEYERSVIR